MENKKNWYSYITPIIAILVSGLAYWIAGGFESVSDTYWLDFFTSYSVFYTIPFFIILVSLLVLFFSIKSIASKIKAVYGTINIFLGLSIIAQIILILVQIANIFSHW